MLQNASNMAPKSTQLGAMLGSKAVMDLPKSEAKTMSKTCLQEVDFLSHVGGILGSKSKKRCTLVGAVLTRPVGLVDCKFARIGKDWQETCM